MSRRPLAIDPHQLPSPGAKEPPEGWWLSKKFLHPKPELWRFSESVGGTGRLEVAPEDVPPLPVWLTHINAQPQLTEQEWLEQHNLLEIEDVIETSWFRENE